MPKRTVYARGRLGLGLVLTAVAVLAGTVAAAELKATMGPKGVTALQWAGKDLLKNGTPQVKFVTLEHDIKTMSFERIDGNAAKVTADRARKQLIYSYKWGSITFTYKTGRAQLDVTTTIRNKSKSTVADFDITILSLMLPEPFDRPKWWRPNLNLPTSNNAHQAVYGKQKVLIGCPTVMPLRFGFGKPPGRNKGVQMWLAGNRNIMEPGGVQYHPYGLPRVAPGQDLSITLTLRFARAETDNDRILKDVWAAYREYHKGGLVWKDRRPIGAIFMGHGKGPKNNPRNWFKDKTININTDAGRKQLKDKMLKFADRCIGVLKSTNAQGGIVWDCEGGENPHPITYIGDPRMVKIMAPEMVGIYPEFFKKFRDAGLRTGVCLRPTQVYQKDGKWGHGTGSHGPERNPLNDDFSKIQPKDLPWWRFYPVVERMSRKIEFAKKNWGCTLFYVDTNGVHRQIGENRKFKWTLLDNHIWRDLQKRHPDVLLIPEFSTGPGQLAYTSVYLQPPYSAAVTNAHYQKLIPGAFSVSYSVNLNKAEWAKKEPQFLDGIKRGDSMFFRGWFGDRYNKIIKGYYDQIYKPGAINPGLPEGYGKNGGKTPSRRRRRR